MNDTGCKRREDHISFPSRAVHHGEAEPVLIKIFSGLQGLAEFLPEQLGVLPGLRPAQVGLPLQQLPYAVVRRQLRGGNVLQEHQDQHVLVLIEQTEAGRRRRNRWMRKRTLIISMP